MHASVIIEYERMSNMNETTHSQLFPSLNEMVKSDDQKHSIRILTEEECSVGTSIRQSVANVVSKLKRTR